MSTSTGVGTILSRGQTVPPPAPGSDTFIAVGKVRQVSGPQIKKEKVEQTSLDSTGGFKEYLSGLRDPGELTFDISMDPGNSQHVGLRSDAQNSTALSQRNWRITWPNGETADLVGEVYGYDRDTQPNEVLKASITVQISGVVTFS